MKDSKIDKSIENTDGKDDKTLPPATVNAPEIPTRDSKFANTAFNTIKHGGVNFVANSALSLGITYNVMPTKAAQNFIGKLANVIKPIVCGWGNLKNKVGLGKEISAATRALNLHESARSSAEILCMCIGGTVIIIPMKWMENHKKAIIDKIDRWKNPEYHKYCKTENIPPAQLPYEKKEQKEGWSKLLSARAAGVVSVISIDAIIQNFNNHRVAQGKGNVDTAEWKLGSKIYDKLPTSFTDKIVNFFSARKTSDLSGIQKPILKRLEQTVGNDRKRMIFSEQTRLLSKEISLTAVLATIMYSLVETGAASSILNKLGFKKPKEQHQAIDDMLPDIPFVPITQGKAKLHDDDIDKPQKKYTDKIKPARKEIVPSTQAGFLHKHALESAATQPSI